MTRFMAIQSVPGLTEQEFRQVFSTPRGWKPGGGATILKVYCDLDRGKVFTECEAVQQSHFEDWMKRVGWSYDAIYTVDLVHQTGSIWRL